MRTTCQYPVAGARLGPCKLIISHGTREELSGLACTEVGNFGLVSKRTREETGWDIGGWWDSHGRHVKPCHVACVAYMHAGLASGQNPHHGRLAFGLHRRVAKFPNLAEHCNQRKEAMWGKGAPQKEIHWTWETMDKTCEAYHKFGFYYYCYYYFGNEKGILLDFRRIERVAYQLS